MRVLRSTLFVCLLILSTAAVNAASINTGSYARSVAMGGAGLALTDQPVSASLVNPAAFAVTDSKLRLIFPSFDLSADGASVSELKDRLSEIGNSSTDDAIRLAEDFGSKDTTLNASLVGGITGPVGVAFEAEAEGFISPGANFRTWVNAGTPTEAADFLDLGLDPDTFTDGTYVSGTLLYSAPSVTYGRGFSTAKGDKLWVGTKMKWMKSEYRRWDITSDVVDTDVQLSSVEHPTVKDNGIAADLGVIYKPANQMVQWGMVINNLWNPRLSGVDTSTMFSIGAAAQPNPRFIIAADLVNINRAYGENPEMRIGAEFKLTNKIALRGGYTGDNFTYGFGAFGMDISFSSDSPAMLSHTLRF